MAFGVPFLAGILGGTYLLTELLKPSLEKKQVHYDGLGAFGLKRSLGKTLDEELADLVIPQVDDYTMVPIVPKFQE